ncbi:uncharacterized protein K02A2.6-like [Lineus longissimus]|uniref:uncharacterized protein K02A2.6-like n=1 Tax=Lineus longissimus TaxID=88925 RepID=UPI00315D9582
MDDYKYGLIEKVRHMPLLWDPEDPDYKNKDQRQQAWEKLESEIHPPKKGVNAKQTWEALNRAFNSALSRRKNKKSGSGQHDKPWKFETSMSYVKGVKEKRNTISNLEDNDDHPQDDSGDEDTTTTEDAAGRAVEDTADVYGKAVRTLDAHFLPKVNEPFERHVFRGITQKDDETVDQFVSKLKNQAALCNFANQDIDIRDQVIEKCRSAKLKRKLLEQTDLTLNRALEIARVQESVNSQMAALSLKSDSAGASANFVSHKHDKKKEFGNKAGRRKFQKKKYDSDSKKETDGARRGACYRCGNTGHFGKDPSCPAKGQKCSKCGGNDNFAKVCRSSKAKVNNIAVESDSGDDFAFVVNCKLQYNDDCINVTNSKLKSNTLDFDVGGVKLSMLVDSGATVNIIGEKTWKVLKKAKINCQAEVTPGRKVYTYASAKPLLVKGRFTCEIKHKSECIQTEVLVIKGAGLSLLSSDTATALGVLRVGPEVNAVVGDRSKIDEIVQEFRSKGLFDGLGKIKGRQIELELNPEVRPVEQPVRRTPFGLRKRVESKIRELIEQDVIEPVEEPTPWVSPIVVVPKSSGDVRLCMDMRRVNEAIVRERHPIPTMDEILQGMSKSNKFSKLDLRWGYHQLELHVESRKAMTFAVSNCGLYRYKRLPFGVNAASELYQHEIHKIIQGLPGVENISDDIIVHGLDEEHDERLRQCLSALVKSGATLNWDKCLFGVNELDFFGTQLSDKGIDITRDKVAAISNARQPENASEVRSFLGLVTFCARFIPKLASVADPLRRLTRKDQQFVFGKEETKSFEKLKEIIGNAKTLAYFDVDAKTSVMADAGPVGLGAMLLQEQNGVKNYADTLSRLIPEKDIPAKETVHDEIEDYIRFVAIAATLKAVTTRDVEQASKEDKELSMVRECIDTGNFDECNPKLYRVISSELCKIGKLVLRGTRIVIPQKLRQRVLNLAHEGHLGVVGTKQTLRTKVWWPGMERDAEKLCKSCHGCQITGRPNPPEPIRSTQLPSEPWEDIAVEFLGPLPQGDMVLVVVDYYSRYYELEVMKTTTAEKTIRVMRNIFARHGLPMTLFSDNRPQFISDAFKEYMAECGIRHHLVTPKWPQANGEVERQNASLVKHMKLAQAEGGDWKLEVLKYVASYRAKAHPSTGKSPAELLFGRKMRTKIPEVRPGIGDDQDVRDRDSEQKGKSKLYADDRRNARESDIQLGDSALLRRERQGTLDTPL